MGDTASLKDYLSIAVVSLLLGLALAGAAQAAVGQAPAGAVGAEDSLTDIGDLSQGIAANVNDVCIGEAAITAYIENFRDMLQLSDDDAWAEWLAEGGYTPEQIRAETIELYISQEELRQAAASEGIEVSDAEIDEAIAADVKSYSTEDEWRESLARRGVTEPYNRTVTEAALLQEKLSETHAGADPSDEMVLAYARAYAGTWEGDVPESLESLDDVPEGLLQLARESAAVAVRQEGFEAWMQAWASGADIVRYPMPSGLPYDVATLKEGR